MGDAAPRTRLGHRRRRPWPRPPRSLLLLLIPVHVEAHSSLRPGEQRILAGDEAQPSVCHASGSFLGVGNTACLHDNLGAAIILLGVIVLVSTGFERLLHWSRAAIACPQLARIVGRLFQEIMVLGFLSLIIFALNASGALDGLRFSFTPSMTATERLHFYEFFHYVVFLTMLYFIAIVLLLLFIGTVAPKLVWETSQRRQYRDVEDRLDYYDLDEDTVDDTPATTANQFSWCRQDSRNPIMQSFAAPRDRAKSGMDLAVGSKAYALLLHRYEREGWSFRFNLRRQWQLYKSFELLAYNICQHRSGYIYKNANEMHRLFGVRPQASFRSDLLDDDVEEDDLRPPFTFDQYHVLCMRNLLFHMTSLHPSAFVVLVTIAVLPAAVPKYAHEIFAAVGALLLLANAIIFLKVLHILKGIVDDRLRVFTMRDIQTKLAKAQALNASQSQSVPKRKVTFKATALAVRALLRMQMAALCHRALHHHDHRFWFGRPTLLLRAFQFATTGQAFYLVWLSLVELPAVIHEPSSTATTWGYAALMLALPALALFVVTPMTMPSLVLVMSLTGIFDELNTEGEDRHGNHIGSSKKRIVQEQAKIRMRMMRRSFLRSRYSDDEERVLSYRGYSQSDGWDTAGHLSAQEMDNVEAEGVMSPASATSVFLRIYDSPTAAVQHSKQALSELVGSPTAALTHEGSSFTGVRRSGSRPAKHVRSSSYQLHSFHPSNNHSLSLGRASSYHQGHSLGRSGSYHSSYGRSGGSGSGSIGRSGGSLGSSGRDNNGYSDARRHFNLAAFQEAGSNPAASLNRVYRSPPRPMGSGRGHAKPPPPPPPPPPAPPQQSKAKRIPVDNNSEGEASPAPPATFKSYCSKYGGYPEQE